jgi:chromosome segregation ATPase
MLVHEASKVLPAIEDLSTEYKLLERRINDVDRRIARCQEAIEVSNSAIPPLVRRLEALTTERSELEMKRQKIAASTLRRKSYHSYATNALPLNVQANGFAIVWLKYAIKASTFA